MSINILPFEKIYIESIFQFATEIFVEDSTLHKAININLKDYQNCLRSSFIDILDEGLSVIAIEANSKSLIGFILLTSFEKHISQTKKSNGLLAPISAISSELIKQYKKGNNLIPNTGVLVDMAAVAPQYRGEGIYENMRNSANNLAGKRGFTEIFGELSSEASQNLILTKLKHVKVAEVEFNTFKFRGSKPFISIINPKSIILAKGKI